MLEKTEKQFLKPDAITDPNEIAKFDALAQEWWNPQGKFKRVLAFNEARLTEIKAGIAQHFARDLTSDDPFHGLRVLDIGCGAGLLCEPLAKLGADVTGIDGSEVNIHVATTHSQQEGLKITYRHCLAEEIAGLDGFDVVLNTEVIEHVYDQEALADTCARLVKPGGILIMATLDRSFKSWIIAIVGAEYILRMLPRGTHDWHFFVKPEELETWLNRSGLKKFRHAGFRYNPVTKVWRVIDVPDVNYMQFYHRPSAI